MSIIDTRDIRHSLTSLRGLSLEHLGSLYCDAQPWKLWADWDKDEAQETYKSGAVLSNELFQYNAEDALRTAQIYAAMVREPSWPENRSQALLRVQESASKAAAEMHIRGMLIDQDARKKLSQELGWEYIARVDKVRELAKAFDPSLELKFRTKEKWNDNRSLSLPKLNDGDLRHLTYEVAGLPVNARTPTGIPSVNRSDLLRLFLHPKATEEYKKLVLAWWAADSCLKGKSTFVDSGDIDEATWSDNRVHPLWNSCGADTGRWSCKRPSLQVLAESRSEEDADLTGTLPNFRQIYVAGPGRRLVHADWSQLELRVFAVVADDTVLAADIRSGDPHWKAAVGWFGLESNAPVVKSVRRTAKEVNFSGLYGAFAPTIHTRILRRQIFIQELKVEMMRRAMLKRRPAMQAYWKNEMALVMSRTPPYSETRLLGRRRYYAAPPDVPDIANQPIQGTAADLANLSLEILRKECRKFTDCHLITNFHDAFDIDCRAEDANSVKDMMVNVMQREVILCGQKVSFPVDAKIGERWSEV